MNNGIDVFLRKVIASDEREFLRLMRDSETLHKPWIQAPTTSAMFKYYLQRIRRSDHEGYAVCRTEDAAIVGIININHMVRGTFQSASLGYYVAHQWQGYGYMRQGLELLIKMAFTTLGLHRLEANIQPDNERSQALVKSCGFEFEGLSRKFLFIDGAWRDHERWCRIDDRQTVKP